MLNERNFEKLGFAWEHQHTMVKIVPKKQKREQNKKKIPNVEEMEWKENENEMKWNESIIGWSVRELSRFGSIRTVFV